MHGEDMTDDTRTTLSIVAATAGTLALIVGSMFWVELALPDWLLVQAVAAAVVIFGVGSAWYFLYLLFDGWLGGDGLKRGRFW